jgi:hypothetical protein
MSNKFSTIKERILHILEVKGIIKDKFFNDVGMTYGNFTGSAKKTPLNSTAISNIFSKIPDINLEWLITGEGEEFKNIQKIGDINNSNVVGANVNGNGININGIPSDLIEIIKKQQEQISELIEVINKIKNE